MKSVISNDTSQPQHRKRDLFSSPVSSKKFIAKDPLVLTQNVVHPGQPSTDGLIAHSLKSARPSGSPEALGQSHSPALTSKSSAFHTLKKNPNTRRIQKYEGGSESVCEKRDQNLTQMAIPQSEDESIEEDEEELLNRRILKGKGKAQEY